MQVFEHFFCQYVLLNAHIDRYINRGLQPPRAKPEEAKRKAVSRVIANERKPQAARKWQQKLCAKVFHKL